MARSFWLSGFIVSAAVLASGVSPSSAQQGFPNKEIKVAVPSAAGSGGDVTVRYFAAKLAERAKVPVLIENKTGAGGTIASEYVARAKPDGYTLLATGASGTHASAKYLYKNLSYDPQKDFTPITTITRVAMVLAVNPNLPVKDVKELTAYLKAKKSVSFGSSNNASLVNGELYNQTFGLKAVQVPYRSPADGMNDLLGNQIDYMFLDLAFSLESVRTGKLRALAVTSGERVSFLPEIPSLKESGISNLDMTAWWAFFGPAGMPQPIVDKLAGWINEIVALPETKELLATQGTEPFPGNPKMMADFLAKEMVRWEGLLKTAKVEPQ